jgi:diacylglycerol kinase (ATP)
MPAPARPASAQKALLVIKPVAVAELGGDPATHIARRLEQAGMMCEVVETRRDRSAYEVVTSALASSDPPGLVVAAGGDGTHGPAGAALAGSGVPLGLVALGTFNNLARSVAVPRDVDAALDVICVGHTRTIDAGRVNGRLFFEVAGAGWDATLFPVGESLKRGNVAAALGAVQRVLRFRTDEVTLRLDGEREVVSRTPTVVVANGPYFGSAFAVAPTSQLDDGLLSVMLFEGFGRTALLTYFASMAEGTARPDARAVTHRAAKVEVLSPAGLPAHADGDSVGALSTPFEAIPGALTVFAPPLAPPAELRSTMRWSIPRAAGTASPAPQAPARGQQTVQWKAPERPTQTGEEPTA